LAFQFIYQLSLCPHRTHVGRNIDFQRFEAELEALSLTLRDACIDDVAAEMAIENAPEKACAAEFGIFCLRAEVLRNWLGCPSFRSFSRHLASSDLLADFCGIRSLEGIKWSSKSTLERASKFFKNEQLQQLNAYLTEAVGEESLNELVGLESPEDMGRIYADSTCLKANIHYPTDWVLLKDLHHRLCKSMTLIRRRGVICRMPDGPEGAQRAMNRLCIEMTHARRRPNAKKKRKRTFRQMKNQLKRVAAHAGRHLEALQRCEPEDLHWPKGHVRQVVKRIKDGLALVDRVIKQAHERLIGERPISNKKKLLSLYDSEVEVIVRGKAGAETEFGNALFVAETEGGFIVDYELYGKGAHGEADKLLESLDRQEKLHLSMPISEVVTDRGYDSKRVANVLEKKQIKNSICPRSIERLKRKFEDPEFALRQRRRGSTEARIAILKDFGGRVCRQKGLANRKRAVSVAVFSHNLKWLCQRLLEEAQSRQRKAA